MVSFWIQYLERKIRYSDFYGLSGKYARPMSGSMRVAPAQQIRAMVYSISIPLLTLLDTYHYVLYRLTCSVTNTHLLIKVISVTKRDVTRSAQRRCVSYRLVYIAFYFVAATRPTLQETTSFTQKSI